MVVRLPVSGIGATSLGKDTDQSFLHLKRECIDGAREQGNGIVIEKSEV